MDSFQAFGLAGDVGASGSSLGKRQQAILAIPSTYLGLNSGPQPGALVGIVLGAVAGFLLICYLIWAIANFGGNVFNRKQTVVREEEIVRHSSSSRRRRPRTYEEEDVVEVIEEHSGGRRRRERNSVRETTRGDIEGDVRLCAIPVLMVLLMQLQDISIP